MIKSGRSPQKHPGSHRDRYSGPYFRLECSVCAFPIATPAWRHAPVAAAMCLHGRATRIVKPSGTVTSQATLPTVGRSAPDRYVRAVAVEGMGVGRLGPHDAADPGEGRSLLGAARPRRGADVASPAQHAGTRAPGTARTSPIWAGGS